MAAKEMQSCGIHLENVTFTDESVLRNGSCFSFRKDQASNDVEFIDEWYAEMDAKQMETEPDPKDTPWDKCRLPPINYGRIYNEPTASFLRNVLHNLWKATNVICGAPVCFKSTADMFFCEACRDYYHVQCRRETSVPDSQNHYICRIHPRPKTGKTSCELHLYVHLQNLKGFIQLVCVLFQERRQMKTTQLPIDERGEIV